MLPSPCSFAETFNLDQSGGNPISYMDKTAWNGSKFVKLQQFIPCCMYLQKSSDSRSSFVFCCDFSYHFVVGRNISTSWKLIPLRSTYMRIRQFIYYFFCWADLRQKPWSSSQSCYQLITLLIIYTWKQVPIYQFIKLSLKRFWIIWEHNDFLWNDRRKLTASRNSDSSLRIERTVPAT